MNDDQRRELEQKLGIQRTDPPRLTRRDIADLNRRILRRSPFWQKKR